MATDDDRGQATIMLLAALGLTMVALAGLGTMGRAVDARTRARTAADAAALAGAADGEGGARRLASANGGELASFETRGDEVMVEVAVGDVHAFGRARRFVVPEAVDGAGSGGTGERAGLAPVMLAALARADALLGTTVPVVSGYRSRAQQEALWARRASNPYPVAPPGRSRHEQGLAVDVPRGFIGDLLAVAGAAGLCQPLPRTDPVHFELCG